MMWRYTLLLIRRTMTATLKVKMSRITPNGELKLSDTFV